MEKLITVQEAALMARFSEETIRRGIREGALRAQKRFCRWRIKESDLEHFLAAKTTLIPKYAFTLADEAAERKAAAEAKR